MKSKKDIMQNNLPQGWTIRRLGDIGICIKGVSYDPKKDLYQNYNKHTAILLRSNNIQNNALHLRELQFVNIKKVHKKQLLQINDVIICMANGSKNHIGKTACAPSTQKEKYTFGAFMGCFRTTSKQIIEEFLPFLFQNTQYKNHIRLLLVGSSINNLKNSDILSFSFILPKSLAEQTAIAQVLSDVDTLLQTIDKLITKKQQLKTATMQQLLTGKRRLAGFTGSWEKKRLGDITEIKTGNKNNKDKVENGAYPFFVRSQIVERINEFAFDEEAILIPGEGNIGKTIHYINGKFDYHQRVYKISHFSSCIMGKFIYYYLSLNFNSDAIAQSVKATVDSLRLPTFKRFSVKIPPKSEQTAIAQVLSDMDGEIEGLKKKKTKYQQLKKAMMQQLLTGKIRLL